ncbi:hypothetical protein ACH4VS_32615 [Streptomyces hygroscopicus]|uniref:hypothetical protein n=1 Tax=Streptomyces hygroscopicus TaxID=1912 RepID=UPI00082B211E|nr:hypothetical protein [Streptomyces hygroscopicus]GLV78008.1 hypothetical protein Shyhy02_60080 [Streptomyces hygroscopicus subsp. hygroscopicus]
MREWLSHHRRATPAQKAARATEILRAAGYRPLTEYPGFAREPWPATCTTCGKVRYPTVTGVRQDQCKHVRPQQPPPGRRARQEQPGGAG